MAKITKLLKSLLCACLLLGGMMIKPVEAKAEETVTPYASATSVFIDRAVYWVTVKYGSYATNYVPVYVSGSYAYNRAASGNFVDCVDILFECNADNSYGSKSTTNAGIYGIRSLTVTGYEAASTVGIKINYKASLRLVNGTNLGNYYGSITIYQ